MKRFDVPKDVPYVYGIIVDGVLRYVGKGHNGRCFYHVYFAKRVNQRRDSGEKIRTTLFYNKLAKAIRSGSSVKSSIIVFCNSHEHAFEEEARIIYKVGIGQLWNCLSGGEGTSPEDWTNERRNAHSKLIIQLYKDRPDIIERMRISARNKPKDTPETKEHRRISQTERWAAPGAVGMQSARMKKMYETDPTIKRKIGAASTKQWAMPEYRAKQKLKRLPYWPDSRRYFYEKNGVSEEQRKKISESLKRILKENPRPSVSKETRDKIRKAQLGRKLSDETRRRMRLAHARRLRERYEAKP